MRLCEWQKQRKVALFQSRYDARILAEPALWARPIPYHVDVMSIHPGYLGKYGYGTSVGIINGFLGMDNQMQM